MKHLQRALAVGALIVLAGGASAQPGTPGIVTPDPSVPQEVRPAQKGSQTKGSLDVESAEEGLNRLYEAVVSSGRPSAPAIPAGAPIPVEYEQKMKEWMALQEELKAVGRENFEILMEEIAGRRVAELPGGKQLGINALNFPQLDSSTSADPLKQILLCRLLGVEYEWYNFDLSTGFGGFHDTQPRIIRAKHSEDRRDRVPAMINSFLFGRASGTHSAYESLIYGRVDLVLVARAPSPDELELASQQGVELTFVPIARDAFVFISNFRNPVRDLTTEQLKQIYQNKITNWSEVGGPDAAINAYQRDRNSGSQELMETVFMKGDELYHGGNEWETDLITRSMSGPFNKLTKDTEGIGYSVYFYEHFMSANPFVRTVAVDGVQPSFETIGSGAYPYTADVFAVIRANEENPETRALFDWLQSAEGQAVVAESGYVPVK